MKKNRIFSYLQIIQHDGAKEGGDSSIGREMSGKADEKRIVKYFLGRLTFIL